MAGVPRAIHGYIGPADRTGPDVDLDDGKRPNICSAEVKCAYAKVGV